MKPKVRNRSTLLTLFMVFVALPSWGQEQVLVSGATVFQGKTAACYWVNGIRNILPVERNVIRSEASSIVFVDGRIYVSGTMWIGEIATPCIWIDGVRTNLLVGPTQQGSRGGYARSISVNEGKWVVGGSWSNEKTTKACFWTEAGRTDLESPGDKSSLGTIVMGSLLSNGNVYTYGFYYQGGFTRACYWIDTEFHEVPIGEAKESAAYGLTVQNNKVMIVGTFRRDKKKEGYFWNSENVQVLPKSSSAKRIVALHDEVWIVGFSSDNRACFWRNGKYSQLPGETNADQGFEASGLAVLGERLLVVGARSWDQGYAREAILWDSQGYTTLDSKGSFSTDVVVVTAKIAL